MGDKEPALKSETSNRDLAIHAGVAVSLLWLAQPPLNGWPLSLIALVPWLCLVDRPNISRKGYAVMWAISSVYWLLSLQGLRHAHIAMAFPWLALGGYLALYHVLFVVVIRRMAKLGIPLSICVPIAWVGQECVRNYLLTGISALMLGHSMADTPLMIQIADMFGTYGVSFVVAAVNVAVFGGLQVVRRKSNWKAESVNWLAAAILVAATLGYGAYRMGEPLGDRMATFALIQRDEVVEYGQPREREVEIFQSYAQQSIASVHASDVKVDAVVWPESMYSADNPWWIGDPETRAPEEAQMDLVEFKQWIDASQRAFDDRGRYLLAALAVGNPSGAKPHLLAGCGVVHARKTLEQYSGIVHVEPDSSMADWYGKTHLVMFGEYIPIASYIPVVNQMIPTGMGLAQGPGAKLFEVGDTSVAPNICIETAVERVTVNQLRSLLSRDAMPDVVVTVTNDGWFDDSSVIEHHLRCAQLVAVGCRRPILSAANNGPTAWIDSRGQIVQRLAAGTNGGLIATPQRDSRTSLYVRIGDWPAWGCVMVCGLLMLRRPRRSDPVE